MALITVAANGAARDAFNAAFAIGWLQGEAAVILEAEECILNSSASYNASRTNRNH